LNLRPSSYEPAGKRAQAVICLRLAIAMCRWCARRRDVSVQPARRTSVSSTSVTVITPGAGCSIASTATVSTTAAIGCFTFRALSSSLAHVAGAILPQSDWASLAAERKVGTKVKFAASLHYPVSTTRRMLSKKTACMGDEGKAVERRGVLTALLFEQRSSHTTAQAQRSKFKGFLPFVTAIASVFQYRRGS